MRWSGEEIGLGVIVGSVVFVVDEETDGCAEGNTVFGTGLNVDGIELGSLSISGALTNECTRIRPTAVVRSLCPGLRLLN
jgi:hypothetical protein